MRVVVVNSDNPTNANTYTVAGTYIWSGTPKRHLIEALSMLGNIRQGYW